MSEPNVLEISDLTLGFTDRTVLSGFSLVIPARGIVGVLGPAGVGKSTLLRTLARWNEALPAFWKRGRVTLVGCDLFSLPLDEAQRRVPLLAQKARLLTARVVDNAIAEIRPNHGPGYGLSLEARRELARSVLAPLDLWSRFEAVLEQPAISLSIGDQRLLSLARVAAANAECLLTDEPLRDLSQAEADRLAALLERLATDRAVVMVTHNQREAQRMCCRVALVAGGRLVESGPTAEFFREPATELGRSYRLYGNCWPAEAIESEPEPESPAAAVAVTSAPAAAGPRRRTLAPARPGGFHWVVPALLGGMQRPGLLQNLEADLEALVGLDCRLLVNLTQGPGVAPGSLARHGIESLWEPIPDMGVPTLSRAEALCRRIAAEIAAGRPTVVHCKAGLGRTGTILACTLVLRGDNAVRAVERVRAVSPNSIQTPEQLAFVSQFETHLDERVPQGSSCPAA